MGSGAPTLIVKEYQDRIDQITDGSTKYPKQFSDLRGQYYYFLGLFYQYSSYSNIGSINNTLQPSALLNIFSTSNCK